MAIATHPGIPIDLLPDEVRELQRSRRVFVGVLGAGIAILVALGAFTVLQRAQIGSAESDLRATRAEAARLRAETARLSEFGALEVSIERARGTLGTALAADVKWSSFLTDLSAAMPPGARLSTLAVTASPGESPLGGASIGTVSYQGTVPNFPGLSGWLTRMGDLPGLEFVYLENGARGNENELVSFGANAHVHPVMLSGRCQQEDSPCP